MAFRYASFSQENRKENSVIMENIGTSRAFASIYNDFID
ncbi:hypothetical protein PM8797T_30402 [Gimesia maris DSM 8797]|nr:hypothetical protein PM8797T_30402 [Gimesia maris DSM 8797]